eukprot:8367109-Karenia_brevis.AAC.1
MGDWEDPAEEVMREMEIQMASSRDRPCHAVHCLPVQAPPPTDVAEQDDSSGSHLAPGLGEPSKLPGSQEQQPVASDDSKDVRPCDIRRALVSLLANRDLSTGTIGSIRGEVEIFLGLSAGDLNGRQEEVADITKDVVQIVCSKKSKPHSLVEDWGTEKNSAREAYLITFSHPKPGTADDGPVLRAPGEFTREQIRDCLLEAVEVANKA